MYKLQHTEKIIIKRLISSIITIALLAFILQLVGMYLKFVLGIQYYTHIM